MTRHERLELLGCLWFAGVHRQKHTPISIPLPTEWSIRQIGIKKHPLTALLKYSPAVLKSSILSCWQALGLELSRHCCCRCCPINNAHQTHSQLINRIDAGVRVQESMSNHITDLIVGAKDSKNTPFPLPNRLLTKSARGYTVSTCSSTPQD